MSTGSSDSDEVNTGGPFLPKELDILRMALLTRATKKRKTGIAPFWEDGYLMDLLRGVRDQWPKRSAEFTRLGKIIRTLENEESLTKADVVEFIVTAPAVEYPNGKSRFETLIWKVFQPTPENQHLFDAAKALQGVGHRSVDFLTLLAESSGPDANVLTAPIMYRDAQHKKSFPGHTAQMYGVATSFIESNAALFNIGLLVQAPNPVGLTVEKWAKVAWHSVIVIVIHDVKGRIGLGSPGKHFLIGDPNILSFHDKFDHITDILENSTVGILRKLKAKNIWVNLPRPVRNGKGTCLLLACEWLIEVVEKSPGLHYNQEGEIESIDHFRRVQI